MSNLRLHRPDPGAPQYDCLGCGHKTPSTCTACTDEGQKPEHSAYCKTSLRMAGPNGHSHICASHYVRTYLVRAGLLARGMLLRGRIIAYNKMVREIKGPKGKLIRQIHPATPSSEVQFWLLSDTTRHLDNWFVIIFFELLSGKLRLLFQRDNNKEEEEKKRN